MHFFFVWIPLVSSLLGAIGRMKRKILLPECGVWCLLSPMKAATYLVLKDQAQKILSAWNVSEPLPGKGRQVIVAFPSAGDGYRMAQVTKAAVRSTYGKPLYSIVLS
jgi:hypothetical protein